MIALGILGLLMRTVLRAHGELLAFRRDFQSTFADVPPSSHGR